MWDLKICNDANFPVLSLGVLVSLVIYMAYLYKFYQSMKQEQGVPGQNIQSSSVLTHV